MSADPTTLAPGEAIVWQGQPAYRAIARDVFHIRALSAYLAFLFALDAYQAWAKAIPLGKALHDSVPLGVIVVALMANFCGLAWLSVRSTRYTVTTERVILAYGIAIPATLAIPLTRVRKVELAIGAHHFGDIALTLAEGDHMPYLKLWPLARPWRLAHPQPMLRGVPQAAVIAGLLTRAATVSAATRAPREHLSEMAA